MSARDKILGRVRKGLGIGAETSREAAQERLQARLQAPPRGPRPPYLWTDPLERFLAGCAKSGTTVERVSSLDQVPQVIAQHLSKSQLSGAVVAWPLLKNLPWAQAALNPEFRPARDGDAVGITGVFAAIVETATLMLLSGADTPSNVSLLPETHVAVVGIDQLVAGMEEAWDRLKATEMGMPRAVNFVSGPSRTADIEQTIVIGAHGPYRVHVVVWG
jgi:L-lactate dehydrogenase complex protein LldG